MSDDTLTAYRAARAQAEKSRCHNVAELITALQAMPADLPVSVYAHEDGVNVGVFVVKQDKADRDSQLYYGGSNPLDANNLSQIVTISEEPLIGD